MAKDPVRFGSGWQLPPALLRASKLDGEAGRAWDERSRRLANGTATPEDRKVHEDALRALEAGRSLPAAAQRMPTKPPKASGFRPAMPDAVATALACGVPALIADRIVDGNVDETPSVVQCRRLERGEMTILVMYGEKGHGKTYAACDWLINRTHIIPPALHGHTRGRKLIPVDEFDITDKHHAADLGMASAMVMDDVGTEPDYMADKVALLIVRRYRNNLQTIITTNLGKPDFRKRYGGRVASRIEEVGEFVLVGDDPAKSLRIKREEP